MSTANAPVKKLRTGIPGFDLIAQGGLPEGRTTLLSGTAGSAKTVLAAQFLAAGISEFDEPGVFVTFEESPEDIARNMRGLGWDIDRWHEEGKWAFVDASPRTEDELMVIGDYDFGALMVRIENAIRATGAKRLSMDSLAAVFTQYPDAAIVRSELFRVAAALKKTGVTSLLTAERVHEYGDIARFGIEEFVADNVVILRNSLDEEKRRRTIEILKFRGAPTRRGSIR